MAYQALRELPCTTPSRQEYYIGDAVSFSAHPNKGPYFLVVLSSMM